MKISDLNENKEKDELIRRLDNQFEAYFRMNWDYDVSVDDQHVSLESYLKYWYPANRVTLASLSGEKSQSIEDWVNGWENNSMKPHKLKYLIRQRYLHWFNKYAAETY